MANTVSIHVQSFDETSAGFDKVNAGFAKSMKSMIGIAAMAGPALTAPIVAGAAASVAAFASMGVAVGAFGLAVAPQIAKIGDLKANLNTMSPAVRAAAVQFRTMKSELDDWSESLAPKTMPVFISGMQAMRAVIPQLSPLVETASKAFTDFNISILNGVKSGGFKSFLAEMNTSAKVTLPSFLNSLKNVGAGFAGVIRAFLPFSGTMATGMEKITAKFKEFGQGLKGSASFDAFMAGVKDKVPVIIQLLSNLAETALKIAIAFAPVSAVMLGVVSAFAKMFASISQEKLDFLVPMIAAIVIGLKAWAIAAGIVAAAQGALTAAMGINPWVGVTIAVAALAVALYSTKDASDMAAMGLSGVGEAADSTKNRMVEAAQGMGDALISTIKWVDTLGGLMPHLSESTGESADKLGDFADGANFAGTAVADFGASTDGASESAARAAAQVGVFTDALLELANQQLAMSGSLIGLEAAFDAASESVEKNGRTLDITTEKGRSNRTALNGIASAALAVRDKMTAAGESAGSVAGRMNSARSAFIRAATSMGMSASNARKLASDLGLIKNKTVNVSVISKSAEAAIARVNAGIGSLHDKTVFLDVVHRVFNKATSGQSRGMNAHGGIIGSYGHAAEGGPRSNLTWVGEQGPELVSLAPGSTVHSAGDSKRIMENASSSYSKSGGGLSATAAQALKQLIDSIDGKISTIRSKFNAVISIVKQKFDGSQEDSLVAYSKRQIAALEKLAAKREKVAKKLEAYNQHAKQIGDSMRSAAGLPDLDSMTRGRSGQLSGGGVSGGLSGMLSKLRTFRAALLRLQKRGLGRTLFSQIVALGPDEGTKMANEFLNMSKSQMAQVNRTQDLINWNSSQIGKTASDVEFPGSKGWLKEQASLQKAMDKTADKFADKIAAALSKLSKRKGKASGGPTGGMTWVGEQGPELLDLPYGSSVMTAGDSKRMATQGGNNGAPMVVQLIIGTTTLGEIMIDPIRKAVWTRGGNVQAVLGR